MDKTSQHKMQTPSRTSPEHDMPSQSKQPLKWLSVALITLMVSGLSMILIALNHNYLNWPIDESMWCVIAMGLACGCFLGQKLMDSMPRKPH